MGTGWALSGHCKNRSKIGNAAQSARNLQWFLDLYDYGPGRRGVTVSFAAYMSSADLSGANAGGDDCDADCLHINVQRNSI